ncbi:hypothetical protein K9M59_03095 [Candidatus Gracilibacteria bacterium]|nr:hypothetical protein [Candidatus Gracilibacteria bacterium]MCF7819317.1 hypothetical protein [Candidatus Gracilibacteria bacterium]
MDKNIIKKLIDTGLSQNEAIVYLSSLENGTAPASSIAETAGLNRVTTYSVLERLLEEGLMAVSQRKGTKHFTALSPDILIEEIQRRAENLNRSLPLLKSLMGGQEDRPLVRFFKGLEGVQNAYWETLESRTQMLNYANSKNIRDHWPDYDQEYVLERKKKKIFLRGLAPEDLQGKKVQEKDAEYFRETRLLPKKHFWVENEINIYDDKFFIASFDPEPFAIIIQSQTVADTQRQIFEIAWESVEGR